MVESIEIMINNKLIYIDVNNLSILYNNEKKDITLNEINKLLDIIKLWKREYLGNIIDGEEFLIKVNTDTDITTFHGKGAYPKNYQIFKTFLGELL